MIWVRTITHFNAILGGIGRDKILNLRGNYDKGRNIRYV